MTAEIAAGHQYPVAVGPVAAERVIGQFPAVVAVTPAVEAVPAQALALSRGQELGGYDLVGVDIVHRQVEGQ